MTHRIAVGALEPALTVTIFDATGQPVDFTDATSVRLVLLLDGAAHVDVTSPDASLTTTPDKGRIKYSYQAGDTAVAGTLTIAVWVNWTVSRSQRFPASGGDTGYIE